MADGKLYRNFSSDAIECLHQIKKIIRSFPKRLELKSSISYLLFLSVLLNLGRKINLLLPVRYKKTMKNIARKLRVLE